MSEVIEESEISYSNILIKLKSSWRFLVRKWFILCLATIFGASAGWLIQYLVGVKYVANSSFTIQGQSASSSILNSALSLASTLGISAKSGSSGYDNNYFASLLKSRRMVKKSLLEDGMIDGKKDLMANHFIRITELNEKWAGTSNLNGFKFIHNQFSALTKLEDSVLTHLFKIILDDYLVVAYDEISPFNNAKFISRNYSFSSLMMQKLLTNTNDYYINQMYLMNNHNMKIAEKRVDSIANAIRNLDARVATLKDNVNNVIKQSALVDLNSAIRDQGLLSIQYSSAVNNYELAKVTLTSDTPILEVIDDPKFSTEASFIPKLIAIAGGAIGFFFVTLVVLVGFNFINNTLENEKQEFSKAEKTNPVAH